MRESATQNYLSMRSHTSLNFLRFCLLSLIKISGKIIYPLTLNWRSKKPNNFDDVSLIIILNHTSLFEFIFAVVLPFNFLRQLSKRLVISVASKTMNKPLYKIFFSRLAPKTVTLTRKRDQSWETFLNSISSEDICIFLPEGRMKRKNGLDCDGNPMTIRGGVYDLLQKYQDKQMIILYSHGLQHVFAPEHKFPRVFKRISADIEHLAVKDYMAQFEGQSNKKRAIISDLQNRKDNFCGDYGISRKFQ